MNLYKLFIQLYDFTFVWIKCNPNEFDPEFPNAFRWENSEADFIIKPG